MQKEQQRVRVLESFELDSGFSREHLHAIIKLASNICKTPISLIDIIDEFSQSTIAAFGDWEEKVIPREKSICERIVVDGRSLIVNDVWKNREICSKLSEEDKSKIRFYAGAPIKTSDGHILGALCVIDSRPRKLNQSQKESLETLADEVMARLQLNKQSKMLKNKNARLEKYARFLKNSADILCIIDSNSRKIVDINDDVQSVLGFDRSELIGKKFIDFIIIEQISLDRIYRWFHRNSTSERRLSLPIQLKHKDGKNKWFRCNFTTKDEQWYLTARDITKQKIAEDKIQNLKSRFEQIARASSDIIWEYDIEKNELTWSEDITELFGYPETDRLVTYEWWLRRVHPDDRSRVGRQFKKAILSKENYWSSYYRFNTFKDGYRYVFDNSYIERNEAGDAVFAVGALADITELKQSEIRQKNLLNRIQHANHIAKMGYWEYDLGDQSIFWSDEMYHILNISDSSTRPALDYILEYMNESDRKKLVGMIDGIARRKKVGEMEHCIMLPKGKKKYLYHRGELKKSENEEPDVVVITTQDITERKEIELNLSRSLKEKEILLAEINHRVKNNLAIVSGLLEMETFRRDNHDEKYMSFIRRSQMRIASIAKLHELLYQSDSFTHVSFKKYIQELLEIIKATIDSEQLDLKFNTRIDEMKLNINQAVPCGLILSELISNAVKHAFKGKKSGVINVSFTKSADLVEMQITDNGSGLSSGFDISENKNLGLTLVEIQTRQLGGRFSIESKNGTVCKITFNKKDGKGSSSSFIKNL